MDLRLQKLQEQIDLLMQQQDEQQDLYAKLEADHKALQIAYDEECKRREALEDEVPILLTILSINQSMIVIAVSMTALNECGTGLTLLCDHLVCSAC